MKNIFESDVILPLDKASHRFLEVLVHKFLIKRMNNGFCLKVEFDNSNPAIWSNTGKNVIQGKIPDFRRKAKKYQDELDTFFLHGQKGDEYSFDDPVFPFRYASGGTLPIIHQKGKEYYCFFYREIEPIGWNIANGGCDSKYELLNPVKTIERELREELVAFNSSRKEWLLFESGEGAVSDSPEFDEIRERIVKEYPEKDFKHFTKNEIPLKWLDSPDELHVIFGTEKSVVKGCLLNINAEDFGIEIDRIAWILIDPESIYIDGEIWEDTIVGSPVGFFEVKRFNELIRSQKNGEFFPDIFFYQAERFDGGEAAIKKIIEKEFILRMDMGKNTIKKAHDAEPHKYKLCPVTRQLVQRYISTLKQTRIDEYDIFISFSSKDRDFARILFNYLQRHLNKRIFFDEKTLHSGDISRQIDRALESAGLLIVVGSSIENITEPYVEYEWRAFHVLRLSDRDSLKNKKIVPYLISVEPKKLPLPLRVEYGLYIESPENFESNLPKLLESI